MRETIPGRLRTVLFTLLGLTGGFLMVLTYVNFADFAPVKIPVVLLYAFMMVQGFSVTMLSAELSSLLLSLLGMDALSLGLLVAFIAAAMHGIGMPLAPDFIVGWVTHPLFINATLLILLQGTGLFVAIFFRKW
jgi:hypothetical protein